MIRVTADTSTSLADLGTPEDFLGLPAQDDGTLELLLLSAIQMGEAYTGRKFLRRTYEVKLSGADICPVDFDRSKFELELTPIDTITSFTVQAVSLSGIKSARDVLGVEIVETYSYPVVYFKDDLEDLDLDALQPFTLVVEAGFAQNTIPVSIQLALKQHVSYLFANRGDAASESMDAMPELVKRSYMDYRIMRPAYCA